MIEVAIVGGTGYTGIELVRILLGHPHVNIKAITSRTEAGLRVDVLFPSLRGLTDLYYTDQNIELLKTCDVVFFATPHGVAMKQAKELIDAGVKIIDLAADFRLKDTQEFEKWYSMQHTCPELLAESVYGLPEMNREQIKQARIIGNPGCYPTTVQLGLLPLMEQHTNQTLVVLDSVIVDAKSGVSGAGRKAEMSLLFTESSDSFKAYAVAGHRHHPEIVQGLSQSSQTENQFNNMIFTPHLVPMIRGMLSTIYINLSAAGQKLTLEAIQRIYETRFSNEPFVDVMPLGSLPETRSVRGSNQLRIALHRPNNGKTLIIIVVQDNLVKGAAGQAVQNMNIMFGFDETSGLGIIPLMP